MNRINHINWVKIWIGSVHPLIEKEVGIGSVFFNGTAPNYITVHRFDLLHLGKYELNKESIRSSSIQLKVKKL